MRSDDCSANNDRERKSAVPWQLPQHRVLPSRQPHQRSSASHGTKDETEHHGGNHFPSFGRQPDDRPNDDRREDHYDLNPLTPIVREEYISVEMMFENPVSLKNRFYYLLRQLEPEPDQ